MLRRARERSSFSYEKFNQAQHRYEFEAVKCKSDFQFSNERFCRAGLCAWLECVGGTLILTIERSSSEALTFSLSDFIKELLSWL